MFRQVVFGQELGPFMGRAFDVTFYTTETSVTLAFKLYKCIQDTLSPRALGLAASKGILHTSVELIEGYFDYSLVHKKYV